MWLCESESVYVDSCMVGLHVFLGCFLDGYLHIEVRSPVLCLQAISKSAPGVEIWGRRA